MKSQLKDTCRGHASATAAGALRISSAQRFHVAPYQPRVHDGANALGHSVDAMVTVQHGDALRLASGNGGIALVDATVKGFAFGLELWLAARQKP